LPTVTLADELIALGEADLALARQAMHSEDVQRRVLALITTTPDPGVGPKEIAMLRDRVLVNEGRDQIYGTQVAGVADGRPVLRPVEHPDGLAARRAEVGLPHPCDPLACTRRRLASMTDRPWRGPATDPT
jgi:hypothetical protein